MVNLAVTPDWSDGIRESYDFLTDIFVSRSGREQRRAMRQHPRMSVNFASTMPQSVIRQFQYDKLAIAGDPAICGRFGYRQIIATVVSPTVIAFESDAAPAAGVYCLYSGFQTEYVTISGTVLGDPWASGLGDGFGAFLWHATLSAPLTGDWIHGGILVPAVECRLGTTSNFSAITDSLATAQFDIALLPGIYPAPYAELEYSTLNGLRVLTASPDWTQGVNPALEFRYQTVDFSVGRDATFTPTDFLTRLMTFTLTFSARQEADRLISLFCQMKGRAGEFYCPTWLSDLTPALGIAAGASEMFVTGDGVFDDTVHTAIYIALKAGGGYPVSIASIAPLGPGDLGYGVFDEGFDPAFEGVTPSSDSYKIVLDAAFPANLSRDEIAMICWMPVCRFASDQLSVTRITDEVTQITVNVMSLETLP